MPPKAPAPAPKARPAPARAPDGCAFARHPDGGGCSYRGVDLEPDANGRLLVPIGALDELAAHGILEIVGK